MSTLSSQSVETSSGEDAAVEARIEALRAELEATPDRARQALIQYEIGHLTQHALGNEGQAVREYLGAYNLDPQLRPPLLALVSIFERRRSTKNLLRLYDAEARSATTPRQAASALADRAVLMSDQMGEAEEARSVLEAAHAQAPEAGDIALLLEHQLLRAGDRDAAIAVIEARADLVEDPALATLLRLEVAHAHEQAGNLDAALSVLRAAVSTPAARWRVLERLERVARAGQRYPELVVALDGRARLALADARGEDQGQASGAFSIRRFADEARALAEAAALHREAGRVRLTRLGDPEAAARSYGEAIGLRPEDALLRYERMLANELAGDIDAAAADAEQLLAAGVEGPEAAPLHFRLSERAMATGDVEAATAHMRAAFDADPSSAVAAALLDDLSRAGGDAAGALELLVSRADGVEGDARAQRYWEAAHLAADVLADAARARELFSKAAAAASEPRAILREALAAALRLGDADGAHAHVSALLEQPLDEEERGALLRDHHELLRLVLEDDEAADATLSTAIEAPAARAWAPDLARLTAAQNQSAELLAKAHTALAERAADAETAAAHLSAAARSLARAGLDDAAVEALRGALGRSPTHPYAVALLEEVLRARGDAEEVVRLLREAAEKADAPRAAVTQLLLAGAAAEAADDFDRAVSTYREAAERDATSLAPLLAIRRLAEARGDEALLESALVALGERELTSGEVGRHTLALGEHYDLRVGDPALAERTLRAALASDSVGLLAAVDLALLPDRGEDVSARLAGLERMRAVAGDEAKRGLLREIAGTALAGGDLDAAERALDALRARSEESGRTADRWAPIGRLRLLATEAARGIPPRRPKPADGDDADAGEAPSADGAHADRPAAWLALGHATEDGEVAPELLLAGLRAHVLGAGEDAIDDAVILAHDVMAVAPDSLAASVAVDEALSAGDDPDGRADALGRWRDHAGAAGRLAMESAHGRALAAAGRSRDALEVLLRVAVREPDDLASWEAIRVCARDCEAWEPLVESCDRLAHLLDDAELTMLLLEESAAVLMDELGQDDRAERRLRRILALDARRPIAYGRLHDLLAERGDDAGLLELVENRIELVDDVDELNKLFYEQARLLRSLGRREDALTALDNLLMLETGHVGGLALLVELQVQQENWGGAVEALRSLAGADDVPDSQRRIARLGAADFLETKLDDAAGAYAELEALHEAQLADRPIYERMASVAARLERWDEATAALGHAVGVSTTAETIAKLERRIGAMHAEHRQNVEDAVAAYERALAAVPTDLEAAEAMAALLELAPRIALSVHFEQAVRLELDADPTDTEALRKLRRAAIWRDDGGLERVALATLVALGEADDDEHAAYLERSAPFARAVPRRAIDDAAFEQLCAPGDGTAVLPLAQAIAESVAEMDGLEPGGFGLGRGDHEKADSPLRAELRALGEAFGVRDPELFVGGDDPHRLDLLPYYKGKPTWIAGTAVKSPLGPDDRFTIGMLAGGARLGVAPLVRRGPEGAATAIFAAATAAEVPLPAGQGRAGMAETTRRLHKAMPRKVRKALPPLVSALADGGPSVDAWAHLATRTAWRAGLVLANDVGVGLRRVLGAEPSPELVRASADACDLLLFWLSPGALALRRGLGLSA